MKSEFTMTLLTELKYSLSGIKRRFIVSLHSEASSECVQWSNGYSIRHVFSKRIALFVIFGLWELEFFCTVLYIILINQLNRVQCCNRLLFLASIYYESEKFNASSEREQYFIVWVHPEVNIISISGFLFHGFWLCPALFLKIGYFYLHKRKNQKIYNSTLVQNMLCENANRIWTTR